MFALLGHFEPTRFPGVETPLRGKHRKLGAHETQEVLGVPFGTAVGK